MNTVVLGLQWGDEGKGKAIDYLAGAFDVVARFQGGHNAGHTVYYQGRKVVLHVLPSGIFYPDCLAVIANGVVVQPLQLVEEIRNARALGPVPAEPGLERERAADPPFPPAAGRRFRGFPLPAHRHHPARHRPGLRGRHRPPGALRRRPAARERVPGQDHHAGGVLQPPVHGATATPAKTWTRPSTATCRPGNSSSPMSPTRPACCNAPSPIKKTSFSRGRRAACWTSTWAPTPSSPPPTPPSPGSSPAPAFRPRRWTA